jgi:hypothetical protein
MARKPKVTPKKTAPANRQGSIASKTRAHTGGGSNFSSTQMRTGGIGDRNSDVSNRGRAKITADRMKRTRAAQNTAVKKAAGERAASSAAMKKAAGAVAKRAGAAGMVYSGAKALVDLQRKTSAGKPKNPTSGPRKKQAARKKK